MHLRSVRERHSRRLGAHAFRLIDVVVLVAVTIIVVHGLFGSSLAGITLAEAGPLLLAARVTGRSLRSSGLYRFGRSDRLLVHLAAVVFAAALGMLAMFAITMLLGLDLPLGEMLVAWFTATSFALVCTHLMWWSLVTRWRRQGWLTPNIVVVGATSHAEQLISEAISRSDMNVLGIFDDRLERSPHAMLGVPLLGDTDALLTHRTTPYVDLIVVAVDPAAVARVRQITAKLAVLPNPLSIIFDPHDDTRRAAAIEQLADSPLAPIDTMADEARRSFMKRVQDLAIGLPALVLLSPLFLVLAIAVRLDSPGPVLFRQRRHGFNNEHIVVWKFRTMRHETADHRAERQVVAHDDRVTRVGRILRKTSLDELPQLVNVVKGEMSLVGPRPHAVGMKTGGVESAQLVAEYAHRHRIKPGMTGYAAIKGSRGPMHDPLEVARRVELDIEYIDRQSFWLDLRIILLTVPSILGDRSAVR